MSDRPVEMRVRRAELLDDIVSHISAELREFGVPDDVAAHAGHALADHFADHWGGQVISVPKDAAYKLSERERAILEEYRHGAKISELAAKYHYGERGMRKLLRRAQGRDIHLQQMQFTF